MPHYTFHENKLKELLDAYKNCSSPFVKGVILFYICVHTVDYCLSERFSIHDISTHRGRKKYITENFDEKIASHFSRILSLSLSVRYNELTSEDVVDEMRKVTKDLVKELHVNYQLPENLYTDIVRILKS